MKKRAKACNVTTKIVLERFTFELEVECTFFHEPADTIFRDHTGKPTSPETPEKLTFEGAKVVRDGAEVDGVHVELTKEEIARAEQQLWDERAQAVNDF